MKTSSILWEEPNRRETPLLHIAASGARFSTLTGLCWIDENRFVVNHRDGLRVALFDLHAGPKPVAMAPIPHLTDDVAAKKIGDDIWEVAVSGCWDRAYSLYHLTTANNPEFTLVSTQPASDGTFSHGVAYDNQGRLWLAYSTGKNPRIVVDDTAWLLPEPWGARDICYDEDTKKMYAIAVSNTPKLDSYEKTAASIWVYDSAADAWNTIATMDNVHIDACQTYKGRIWVTDQLGNRVLGIDLAGKKPPTILGGKCFDFPHGLGISKTGILGVSNYGSSKITLCDLNTIQE